MKSNPEFDNFTDAIRPLQTKHLIRSWVPPKKSSPGTFPGSHFRFEVQELCEHSSNEWGGSMDLDQFLMDLFNNAEVHWHYFDEIPHSNYKVAPEQSRLTQNVITSLRINVRSTPSTQ